MPRFHNRNGDIIQFTAAEEAARDAEEQLWFDGTNDRAAAQIREDRDAKLAACDWMANSDVTMSNEWTTYRAALRDVPSQAEFPNTVTWPTKPE